ncbi:MAG: hypothetical protein ACYC9V_05755 [Desulfobacteria bacterium]
MEGRRKGEGMKKLLMLAMAFVMMLVSLGGCYWGFDGPYRDGGYGRGEGHHRGGDRDDDHEERD